LKVSIVIAAVGLLASAVAVFYLKGREPRHYWLAGLAGLFPAWLIAFLILLQPASQSPVDVPLPPRALFSSAAGLLGVIATDYFIRRAQAAGRELSPVMCWIIGWVSLIPAWLIAAVSF
jgi:uncharacterized membrane protein (GlpM family)